MATVYICNMFSFVIVLNTVLSSVICGENFFVSHSPEYVKFRKSDDILQLSQVPDLIAATYGLSPKKNLLFSGMAAGDLFHRPKANVLFSIDGFIYPGQDLDMDNIAKYRADNDQAYLNTEEVSERLQLTMTNPLVLDFSADVVHDVKSQYPELFSKLRVTSAQIEDVITSGNSILNSFNMGQLNISHPAERMLLSELHLIADIINALKENPKLVNDNTPDFFHFRLGGFRKLSDVYGADDPCLRDALVLMQQFIKWATEEFKTLYEGNVVVEVITMSGTVRGGYIRKGRNLMATADDDIQDFYDKMNVEESFTDEYPSAFNIILWVNVVFYVTVFAISCAMWNMDPGRDSIIYRMTTTRIKKD